MLIAILNIVRIVFWFDESRLGREESEVMESEKVLLYRYCDECSSGRSLTVVNEKMLCDFCRNKQGRAITKPEPHFTRLRRWIGNLLRRRGLAISK